MKKSPLVLHIDRMPQDGWSIIHFDAGEAAFNLNRGTGKRLSDAVTLKLNAVPGVKLIVVSDGSVSVKHAPNVQTDTISRCVYQAGQTLDLRIL